MLEISWSELLILAVVTLLFVGPKELPVFLRTIGRYVGMVRRHAADFRAQFDAAMREAELDAMKKEMESMQASVNAEVMGAQKTLDDASRAASLAQPSSYMPPNFASAALGQTGAAMTPLPTATSAAEARAAAAAAVRGAPEPVASSAQAVAAEAESLPPMPAPPSGASGS